MSKIINISPDLFKSTPTNGGTRKKRNSNTDFKIKVKNPNREKDNNKTTKRALLKYIRNQQEKNYEKSMKSDIDTKLTKTEKEIVESSKFNSDFEESLKYLKGVAEQNAKPVNTNTNNHTLRNTSHSTQSDYNQLQPIQIPQNVTDTNVPILLNSPLPIMPKMQYPVPQFGCLKNGQLPTYRNWKNCTQKVSTNPTMNSFTPPQSQIIPKLPIQRPSVIPIQHTQSQQQQQQQQPLLYGGNKPIERESILNNQIKKQSEMSQFIDKNKKEGKKNKIYYPKQKRTVRRTYTVGKSKVHPKISVLISNKTIRNNITSKTQLLKQIPITDVKKYLIKHGFIKVGTTAPNDVLRKMYETAIMVCGTINNHNPDNLLYNYFNEEKS